MGLLKISRIESMAVPPPAPTNAELGHAIIGVLTQLGGPLHDQKLQSLIASACANATLSPFAEERVQEMVQGVIERMGILGPLRIVLDGQPTGELASLRHPLCETLLKSVAADLAVFLVGPTGSGKTTACRQVADAMGTTFYMSGAATGAHDFLGFTDAYGRYQTTSFREAFTKGGLFLADEIDGSDPAALLVLNSALANGIMQFPDQAEPVRAHPNFRMVAAANTIGMGADRQYVGRTQLDAATLDRFVMLEWPYAPGLEAAMCGHPRWVQYVQKARETVAALGLRHIISPRASLYGARLLAAGVPIETVQDMALWKGLDAPGRQKILEKIGTYRG